MGVSQVLAMTPTAAVGVRAAADMERLATAAAQTAANALLTTAVAAMGGTVGDAMTSVAVNMAAGAGQAVQATPGAGHQLWVYGYELHANVAGTLQLLSAATAKTGIMPVGANGGVARDSAHPIFKCATNEALNLTAVTCAVDGIVTFRDVTV